MNRSSRGKEDRVAAVASAVIKQSIGPRLLMLCVELRGSALVNLIMDARRSGRSVLISRAKRWHRKAQGATVATAVNKTMTPYNMSGVRHNITPRVA